MTYTTNGICALCKCETTTRVIDLCVFGSEGLQICHACEMMIIDFCRRLLSENVEIRKQAHKKRYYSEPVF